MSLALQNQQTFPTIATLQIFDFLLRKNVNTVLNEIKLNTRCKDTSSHWIYLEITYK